MGSDSFGTRDRLTVDDTAYQIYRLDRIDGSQRLPYSLNVLLENLLRQHTWPSTPVTIDSGGEQQVHDALPALAAMLRDRIPRPHQATVHGPPSARS